MAREHAYPPDLSRFVEAHWPAAAPLRVPAALLDQALSAAFQASLMSEEGRPIRFRLLLTPAHALPEDGAPNEGVLRLRFDHARPLNADELRRLSPAAPFETSLIGAEASGNQLRIWGVAHSGPAWLAPTWGGRSLVPIWTSDPIVHVSGPGKLAVRCAGKLVGAIERGVVVDAAMDVFGSEWLKETFATEREQARAQHAAQQLGTASPTLVDGILVGRLGQHMLRRAIQLIRGTQHGGMLLAAEPDARGLRLKYRLEQDEPARRYRTLMFRIFEALAAATSKASVGWSDFADDPSPELEKLEEAVFEWSRVLSNLASIDGAVVLDKRLGLLGFGAEVSADLPSPPRVFRALDTEGNDLLPDDIENVGTRHRAAYRFVHAHPGSVAIVVSQDGGVTFVANRDGKVVFWTQSVSP